MNANFEKLIRRSGGYSLPYLIHLYDHTGSSTHNLDMYFVNNTDDITYNEQTYKAAAFSYTPNGTENGFDGGGSLEIEVKNNSVIDLALTYRHIHLDVIGAIDNKGTVTEIKAYKHQYGTITGTRTSLKFEFDKDDRLDMTFPTLIWSSLNNRGN